MYLRSWFVRRKMMEAAEKTVFPQQSEPTGRSTAKTRRIALLITALLLCFGQYLFFIVRNRFAPTPTGQLAGSWVGVIEQNKLDYERFQLPPGSGHRYGVLLTFRTQLWGTEERMAVHMSACTQTGLVSSAHDEDARVIDGGAMVSTFHWTGPLSLDYVQFKLPGAPYTLAWDAPFSNGYAVEALTEGYPPTEGGQDLIGAMHRGTPADFETLCKSLRK